MRRCPTCSTPLFRQKVPGIPSPANAAAILDIDACAGCAGAWLEDGELSALGRAPAALRKLATSIRATQPALAPARTGLCPGDGKPLAAVEYPSFPGLIFQGCGTCRGVWCDAGVLPALADRLAPVESPAPVLAADGGVAIPISRRAITDDATSTSGLPLVRAVSLPSISPPSGFFDRFARGFAFIQGAYSLAFEKMSLLVPTVIGLGVSLAFSAAMFGVLFAIFSATGGMAIVHAGSNVDVWFRAHRVVLFFFGGAWSIGGYFIGFFFMGMTMSMIDAYLKGREPELGTAFRDAVKNFAGILQLAIVSFLVALVIGMVRGNRRSRGISGALFDSIRAGIAKMIEEAWTVFTFLLLPVIMIEDVNLKSAVLRVRDIHRGNLLQIAVGEIGIALVGRAVGFVVFLMAAGAGFALFPLGMSGIVTWIVGLVAVLTVLGVLQSFVRAAYYTCLYLWAVEVERAGGRSNVMVPAPLAAALR